MRAVEIFRQVLASYYGQPKSVLERDYLLYRFVYRPLSFPLTVVAIAARLGANQVSALNVLVLAASLALLAAGTGAVAVAGAGAFFLFYVLDFVDGNVARYHRSASYFGKLIDGFIDTLAYLIFIAAAVAEVRGGRMLLPPALVLALGVAATAGALICQNYRLRLAYLKAEIAAAGQGRGATAAGAARDAGPRGVLAAANWLHENLSVSTPVLLLLFTALDLLSVFVLVFFFVHCISGPAGVMVSLARNRGALDVERDH